MKREPVKIPMPRALGREITLLVVEAKRHAQEIYGDQSIEAANKILAMWLWHAARGTSPTFLHMPAKRTRRKLIEGTQI